MVGLRISFIFALLAFGNSSCKNHQAQMASEVESIEVIEPCRPGLLRWLCRPTSEIIFAVKVDDGYCFYRSSYRGKTPDEKPKYVKDIYSNEMYTTNFPQPYPKKLSKEKLLKRLSEGSEYAKNMFYEPVRDELINADNTPGRVNVSARASTPVTGQLIDELSAFMETAFYAEGSGGSGNCPAPRVLQKSK